MTQALYAHMNNKIIIIIKAYPSSTKIQWRFSLKIDDSMFICKKITLNSYIQRSEFIFQIKILGGND
jgi:hypothetical protein